jgi:hypothetical protein
MTRGRGWSIAVAGLLVYAGTGGCRLRPPDVPMPRMIEPQMIEAAPSSDAARAGSAAPSARSTTSAVEPGEVIAIRLLETQARAHIGRKLLHRERDGELVEDPVWRWTSAPDRYLDSALRLAVSASARVKHMDTGSASTVAATLIEWQIESDGNPRLTAAVELQVVRGDHSVRTQVVRGTEAVSAGLPGGLAAAAGRLLYTLAADCLARVSDALR